MCSSSLKRQTSRTRAFSIPRAPNEILRENLDEVPRSGGRMSGTACVTGEERRLQKVVDKAAHNGEDLLPLHHFLALSGARCFSPFASSVTTASSAAGSSFSRPSSPSPSPPLRLSNPATALSFSSSSAALQLRPAAVGRPCAVTANASAIPSPDAPASTAPTSAAPAIISALPAGTACPPAGVSAAALRSAFAAADSSAEAAAFSSVSAAYRLPLSASASAAVGCCSPKVAAVGKGVVRDAFLIEDVLSKRECAWLCSQTEAKVKYTYWDPTRSGSAAYRSACTVEMLHPSLACLIWDRVKSHVVQTLKIEEEDEARAERDLLGEWIACGINSYLLFARYSDGGHFSPHTDGCTAVDFNTRTFWPALLYLNTVTDGGETLIIDDAQKTAPMAKDEEGRHTAEAKWIVEAVKPVAGHMLFFYYTQMHESRRVGPKAVKYVIRTDVMYTRKMPLLTAPSDKEAFLLWQKAQLLAEEGLTEEAARLFKRSVKLSPALADIYGM